MLLIWKPISWTFSVPGVAGKADQHLSAVRTGSAPARIVRHENDDIATDRLAARKRDAEIAGLRVCPLTVATWVSRRYRVALRAGPRWRWCVIPRRDPISSGTWRSGCRRRRRSRSRSPSAPTAVGVSLAPTHRGQSGHYIARPHCAVAAGSIKARPSSAIWYSASPAGSPLWWVSDN